jgi:hypothetical protein
MGTLHNEGTIVSKSFPSTNPDGSLPLVASSDDPLHVVARAPAFVAIERPPELVEPPLGSVYFDRPPEGSLIEIPINCARTKEPRLRTLPINQWTIEVVVMFLDSPHFGRAWQTIIGRNGYGYKSNMTEAFMGDLAALYIKLTPDRLLLLEAWCDNSVLHTTPYVSVVSEHVAAAGTWYHVVGTSNGRSLELSVNGVLQGKKGFGGSLRIPPREIDGDVTFGCGMFAGVPALV